MNFGVGKTIACMAMIFLAGGATGVVVTLKSTRDREAHPPSFETICIHVQDRLKSKLDLTDAQVTKLKPVFAQTAEELRAVRVQAMRDTDEIICRAHRQVAQELTAEQRRKLEAFDLERRQWMEKRLPPSEKPSPAPVPQPLGSRLQN